MDGAVGILNVGAGDTKVSFDPKNPQDRIRAARIVTDMLKRGYALLVAVPKKGGRNVEYRRALAFDEKHCEYIIADFDPITADEADAKESHEQEAEAGASAPAKKPGNGRRGPKKRVAAESTHAVAVARSAGG